MSYRKTAAATIVVALVVGLAIGDALARAPRTERSAVRVIAPDTGDDGQHKAVPRPVVETAPIQKSADVILGGNEFSLASDALGGWPQPVPDHWHSDDLLQAFSASTDSIEVGETFGDFGEESRGMVEFNVLATPPAVVAASVVCFVEIEGGQYGDPKTNFTIDVSSYDGNNAEDFGDYGILTTGVVDTFATGPLTLGDPVTIDVTDAYNDVVNRSVAALGLRFQAADDPGGGSMTFFQCQLFLTSFDQLLDALEAKLDALEVKADELKPEVVDIKAEITDLKAEITDIKAEITDSKAELVDIKAEIVDIKAEIVAIAADLAMAREERITYACMTQEMIAKYFLPAAQDGIILDVRDLATDRVGDIAAAGEGTNGASTYLTYGNNFLGNGLYKKAYQNYCIALCRASVLPQNAGRCHNWAN